MMRHTLLLTLAFAATTGCAVQRQPVLAEPEVIVANPAFIAPDLYATNDLQASNRERDLVRTGRYTLKSTLPSIAQEDLMSQIIEVTIPGTLKPTVGDALKHALSRSGYTLTESNSVTSVLYSRTLPAAHYQLGPMKLRDTLQVLAGPAWKVQVDEVTRQVQFTLRPGYQAPTRPKTQVALTTPSSAPKQAQAKPIKSSTTAALTQPSSPAATSKHEPVKNTKGSTATVAARSTSKADTKPAAVPATAKSASTASATPATPIVTPAPVSKPLSQIWVANAGSTLKESVKAWAERAGWEVIWAAEDLDYPIAAPLRFEGSFQEAIDQLFPLYDQARRPFIVDGSLSQKVVHIDERMNK